METSGQTNSEENRLDRELAEILERAEKRPISLPDRVARRRMSFHMSQRAPLDRTKNATMRWMRTLGKTMMRIPLVSALALALVAAWLQPEYGSAAVLLALASAAFIFVPFLVRPSSSPELYQKRWRGQDVTTINPSGFGQNAASTLRSWITSVRNRTGL